MATGATRKQKPKRNVANKARMLGRMLLATSLGLGGCALVGWSAWQLLSLPVERVIVNGEMKGVSRQQLSERVSESLEGGFLRVDLRRIRDSVESLPWVYRVVVKRRWPSSLEIQVSEQLPIARWGDEGFLNHAGDLFKPGVRVGEPLDDLPLLSGPGDSQQQVMGQYKVVQDGLHDLGFRVTGLKMDERGSIEAQLAGGEVLVFGRGDTAIKVQRFRQLFRSELAGQDARLSRVDLRYSHGAAVAWVRDEQSNKNRKS